MLLRKDERYASNCSYLIIKSVVKDQMANDKKCNASETYYQESACYCFKEEWIHTLSKLFSPFWKQSVSLSFPISEKVPTL